MKLFINNDIFSNPAPPRVFLCTTNRKIISELPAYDFSLDGKWGSYSEMNCTIDRQYVDILTGEAKIHPAFDKAEGLRMTYIENIGFFSIQDPNSIYSDKDSKTFSAFSSEYTLGSRYLESFHINTGEIDSKEVIYLESVYGENYTIDSNNLYKKAAGAFDEYEGYYIRDFSDSESYVYAQQSIANASVYATYDGSTVEKTLYVKNYPNVRFYWPTKPQLSLLHLILEKAPEWRIGNVDASLWRKERSFTEERVSIYDFLMNNVQDTFDVVVEFDTLTNTINFYKEAEDGVNDNNTIQTRWDTDVFISRDNLANEINISYSTDDIKTKLKVTGTDNFDIREINLGKNYIMNLSFYHSLDWMSQELFEAYSDYLETVKIYTPQYSEAMKNWVAAYNKQNDLENAVPAEGNVVLVGDQFEKLYCIHSPIDNAYLPYTLTESNIGGVMDNLYSDKSFNTVIDKTSLANATTFVVQGYRYLYQSSANNFKCETNLKKDNLPALREMLDLYDIKQDTTATNTDNILLRLKNNVSDIATIRIYYDSEKSDYMIQQTVVRANSGLTDAPATYTLLQWINGTLTANNMHLQDFKINYIGTMGAYLVLAKDETKEATLEEYGVNMLQEKHKVYTTIFQTQTEAMYSQEKYQCVASNDAPTGNIAEGTKWLDTDSSPVKLYEFISGEWAEFKGDLSNYKNYKRYMDNYEKLQAVQNVLIRKKREAEYCSDGYSVPDRRIVLNANDGSSLEENLKTAAKMHFKEYTVTRKSFDSTLPLYTFTTSFDPKNEYAVYLKGTTPYISYASSRGVYQMKMNKISEAIDFDKFFTDSQKIELTPFIREDEFTDSNFLLTGYESEEEKVKIAEELRDAADKELNTLCQPSLKFSMNMANILALPEFKSLVNQFQLGNFVRVYIRDGYVKRSRLLNVHLNFDDLSDFNCEFGNLITTKSEIDKHADLLSQAVTAGKQVAQAAGDWQRAVDKSNKLEEAIASGLADAALEVGKASGQNIQWNENGIWCRKKVDGTEDVFEDEQIRIINNKILYSNDGFKTAKSAFGSFTYNGKTYSGLLAEAIIGGYIESAHFEGGSLSIGGEKGRFVVNEDGSVQILGPNENEIYANKTSVDILNEARRFRIEIMYDKSTVFNELNSACELTAHIYDWDTDVTDKIIAAGAKFNWIRTSNVSDSAWNANHANMDSNKITITNADIENNGQFSVNINFDDSKL